MALWCNGITSTRRVEGPKINTWWGQSFSTHKHLFLSFSSHLFSCLFPHPFFFCPFVWLPSQEHRHTKHNQHLWTHTRGHAFCVFLWVTSVGFALGCFFAVLWFFGFCGFFACLLFSLVTSAGLAPFWAWRFQLVFSFFLSSFFFFPTILATSTWCTR